MDGAEVVKSKMEKRLEKAAQDKEVSIALPLE